MSLSSRTSLSLALAGTLLAVLPVLPTSPATAGEKYPATIPLPPGSQPEGVAGGPRDTFFAGARTDGAIVTGDLRTGKVKPFVDGVPGRIAVGMQYSDADRTLWVAGGTTGAITQYDARNGKELFRAALGDGRFLNDVDVTPEAVYVTDSRNAELVVVPLVDGRPGTPRLLPLTGDYVQPQGFGANGLRVLPGGDLLVVSGRVLYRVDPVTGVADRIELRGPALTGGDGLELDGTTLYVVYGFSRDSVAVVELDPALRSGAVVDELVDSDLDRPTTGTITTPTSLYVVNGRFSVPPTPTTTYELVRVTR